MGKIESKSITVAPDEEQDIIAKYELFGWELKSTQEVLSKDSHLENRGDELYNVTTTQNYVKLMFQRDADSPVAAKARPVEDEYWRLYNRTQPIYFPTKNKLLNLVPLILCGFMLLVGLWDCSCRVTTSAKKWLILLSALCLQPYSSVFPMHTVNLVISVRLMHI